MLIKQLSMVYLKLTVNGLTKQTLPKVAFLVFFDVRNSI